MSFSSTVKQELSHHISSARHCQIAEVAAMVRMSGKFVSDESLGTSLQVRLENSDAADKFVKLLELAFGVNAEKRSKGEIFLVVVNGTAECDTIQSAIKLECVCGEDRPDFVSQLIIQRACCKRAFLRGVFLAGGSISNPEKSYHLEFPCSSQEKAQQLLDLLSSFEIEGKIVLRKKYHVVYLKEGDQIVELLGLMEANQALMNLENIRIVKEVRSSVNRKVNCETANLNKTVNAAYEQVRDIELVRDCIGYENLPEGLVAVANARLENPDMALKELGMLLDPPVGKSGVNHRLKKLKALADSLRGKEEKN